MKYCAYCGKEKPGGSGSFCPYCGKEYAVGIVKPKKPGKSGRVTLAVGLVLLLLGAAAAGVFILGGCKLTPNSIMAAYEAYYSQNYDRNTDQLCFYDVTGDGIAEMLVVKEEDDYSWFSANTVKADGTVVCILDTYEFSPLDTRYIIGLSEVDGKLCLFERIDSVWTGEGDFSEAYFLLDEQGNRIHMDISSGSFIDGQLVEGSYYDESRFTHITELTRNAHVMFARENDASGKQKYLMECDVMTAEGNEDTKASPVSRVDVVRSVSDDYIGVIEVIARDRNGDVVWTAEDRAMMTEDENLNCVVAGDEYVVMTNLQDMTLKVVDYDTGKVLWLRENCYCAVRWFDAKDGALYAPYFEDWEGEIFALSGCSKLDVAGNVLWEYRHPKYDVDDSEYVVRHLETVGSGLLLVYAEPFAPTSDRIEVVLDGSGQLVSEAVWPGDEY